MHIVTSLFHYSGWLTGHRLFVYIFVIHIGAVVFEVCRVQTVILFSWCMQVVVATSAKFQPEWAFSNPLFIDVKLECDVWSVW